MKGSPAFQWYPKDILSSARVQIMTLEEEGAYRRALDFCWINGTLPADVKRLSLLIGKGCSVEVAEMVKSMFEESIPGVLVHERLEQEREKQTSFRDKQAENGRKGGRPPKETQNNPSLSSGLTQTKAKKSSAFSNLHSSSAISNRNTFIPPNEKEVVAYFNENGYDEILATKAFKYYATAQWKDGSGKQVKNWKQKMHVWFKDDHKIKGSSLFPSDKVKVRTVENPTPFEITKQEFDRVLPGYYTIVQ